MKILFVFTGGTIGSTLKDGYLSTDKNKPYALIEAYSSLYGIDFDYDICEPYRALSENSDGLNLKKLALELKTRDIEKNYDGVIVTHGTDSLQYTSAALSYCFGLVAVPICIVSSNYPIEDKRANGVLNLFGAVALIKARSFSGVFTVYKNSYENVIRIHRASRLLSHQSFSDLLFSVFDVAYGYVEPSGRVVKASEYREVADALGEPDITRLSHSSDGIIRLNSYVGMKYPKIDETVKYILIEGYHSGTVDTASESAKAFYREAYLQNARVFLCEGAPTQLYASTAEFESLSITPIYGLTPISLYMKLWLYPEILADDALLLTSRGGDLFNSLTV